jgi:uncharacterized membrane protein (DUF485 family)
MFWFGKCVRVKSKTEGMKKEIFRHKKRMRIVSTVFTFVIIFSLIAIVAYYSFGYLAGSNSAINHTGVNLSGNSLRAALIDALYTSYPNLEFTKSVNKTLQEAGFRVDVYQGGEVTVDFLKKLQSGYRLIILRMHSALSTSNELYLFTAEPYYAEGYKQERYFRLVKEAYATEDSQPVFAVNWGFVKRCMTGKFEGALVIVMGCEGANDPQLFEEFVNQGAVGCVGWNGPVLLSHSDKAVLYLVEALYLRKLSLEQAVNDTNKCIGKDPLSDSVLESYVP